MKNTFVLIALGLVSLVGCRDLFEKDISERQVEVVSPVDKAVTTEGESTFLWREVESATEYHFTLVSPSFASAVKMVSDTVFRQDSIPLTHRIAIHLGPGEYQWRITARNGAYATRDHILTLYVEAIPPDEDGEGKEPEK